MGEGFGNIQVEERIPRVAVEGGEVAIGIVAIGPRDNVAEDIDEGAGECDR